MTAKRGPRPKPLLQRLAANITYCDNMYAELGRATEAELESAIARWPADPDPRHWIWKYKTPSDYLHAPVVRKHNTPTIRTSDDKLRPVARLIFELIAGEELHPTHRLLKPCRFRKCVSPWHRTVVPREHFRHYCPQPLPYRLFVGLPVDPETEIKECIDLIIGIDEGRTMSVADLFDRFDRLYPETAIAGALARIKAEDL